MKASAGNRVLMLLENSTYPEDPRVRREAQALVDAGYRVSVICPGINDQRSRETVDRVRVYRYRSVPPLQGALGFLREYTYAMAATLLLSIVVYWRDGFDVIHAA